MEFLVRFSQFHESFRLAEIQALAVLEKIDLEVIEYDTEIPYCIVKLASPAEAKRLIQRSILTRNIYELWATAKTLDELHDAIKANTADRWAQYAECSFKFSIDCYQATLQRKEKVDRIQSFRYLPFAGPIVMKDPDQEFTLLEDYPMKPRQPPTRGVTPATPTTVASPEIETQTPPTPAEPEQLSGTSNPLAPSSSTPADNPPPRRLYFGRMLGGGSRDASQVYDLKKRRYISTTSMDSLLALITANIALAAPGKLFYDPFVGTGSFPVACAHFGAVGWGSDIDGRAMRGSGAVTDRSLRGNFAQYGLLDRFGSVFTADLTNTPVRVPNPRHRLFDGIVCDPPYGVREGLRVLGCKDPEKRAWIVENAPRDHKKTDYIPPKKPYSFLAMLDDILMFATETLVDEGRLSFWMPTANDEGLEIAVPEHPCLELVSVCTQPFNKWSRRLITYRRIPNAQVDAEKLAAYVPRTNEGGTTADELNPFRRGYFTKFET